jgi:hypothetical protein
MKPVISNEVALWVANQRVRRFTPELFAGSYRKQSAVVMVKRHTRPLWFWLSGLDTNVAA